jgi:hypothetical protein
MSDTSSNMQQAILKPVQSDNQGEPLKVVIEYSPATLKFLSSEMERLHETVRATPDAQWAIEQIKYITQAIATGARVHELPISK